MEALFFGSSISPLYGVYHCAHVGVDRLEGVVMCYPFGQESMRAHRAFKLLSNMLAQKGYHVLRFDYHGTGDSAGDLENVSPHDWLADIEEAVQELRDIAGIKKVSLVSLRLGSLLAGMAANNIGDISRLILWDPVISGCGYIDELCLDIEQSKNDGSGRSKLVTKDGAIYFNGFCMTSSFQKKLKELNLMDLPAALGSQRLLVVSHETADFNGLKDYWAKDERSSYQYKAAPHNWNYVDHVGGIMLPQPVMQAITSWVQ